VATSATASGDRYVLVSNGAVLYTEPNRGADMLVRYRDSAFHDQARREGWASAFRLVEQSDGWLELETIPEEDEHHCEEGPYSLTDFRLRVYAREDERFQLTRKAVRLEFQDDTWVELDEGVPLLPVGNDEGSYEALVDDFVVSLRLPANSVGLFYGAPKRRDKDAKHHRDYDQQIRFERRALRFGTASLRTRGGMGDYVGVTDIEKRGNESLVTIYDRCGRFRVRADNNAIKDDVVTGGLLGGSVDDGAAAFAREGAEVFWRNGKLAGFAAKRAALGTEIDGRHARRCFKRALYYTRAGAPPAPDSGHLILCVNREEVEEVHRD
jgi:hypothetical protein